MKRVLLSLAMIAGAAAAQDKRVSEIRVLARVAGVVITDRRAQIDYFLERPEAYAPGARAKKADVEGSLQRLITEAMANEENKIVGLVQVADKETDEFLIALRKAMGGHWKRFLQDFELSENDLRGPVRDKIVLRKSLAARVRASAQRPDAAKATKEELAQASVDEWLKQLRARYRVQLFRDDG